MPEYTLVYFDLQGRGELIRWLFSYAGIPFKDERVTFEEWPERKKVTPGGQLPVLAVDGRILTQSIAIARYVAKKAGLIPEDELSAAFCDSLMDTLSESIGKWYELWFDEDKSEAEMNQHFKDVLLPKSLLPSLDKLEPVLSKNPWFIPAQMTWADFMISWFFGHVKDVKPEVLAKYPAVDAHIKKIRELPKIKEWIQKSPKSKF